MDPPSTLSNPPPSRSPTLSPSGTREQDITTTALQHHELPVKRKLVIMASVVGTQLIQVISFGTGIDTSLALAMQLGTPSPASAAWIAASYPLTQGAFILPGGRLGAIYGHKNMMFFGGLIWVAFTLGSAFAPSFIVLCILRGLSGMGGGIMVPNCVALLGITFPPGRMRNLAFGLFGSSAPVGAAGGGLLGGIIVQFAPWKWVFIAMAIAGAIVFGVAFLSTPRDNPVDKHGSLDIVGSYLGVGALFLFNFVWNQAPAVGWSTVYIYVLLIVALLHAAAFILWSRFYARNPIIPFTIWTRPSFGPLLLTVFLTLMAFSVFLWYLTIWELEVRHYTLTATGASVAPIIVVGGIMASVGAWLVPRLRAQYIMGLGVSVVLCALILVGTMPAQEVYWAQAFPATLIVGAGPDLIITAAQVIASNSVRRHEQGTAGSLIGVLQTYGLSTGLGFAGTVELYVNDGGKNAVKGYRGALFLAVGFCVLALVIDLLFVRMPADTQEGWGEGDLQKRDGEKDMPNTV
ncbi:MFS general substrate transporter [Peniophora sp. CONT]|nr:MFS general substrate transporter [Peniophora sp. CONT]